LSQPDIPPTFSHHSFPDIPPDITQGHLVPARYSPQRSPTIHSQTFPQTTIHSRTFSQTLPADNWSQPDRAVFVLHCRMKAKVVSLLCLYSWYGWWRQLVSS